jgi:hypothetical protein
MDQNGTFRVDARSGFIYWDPDNGVNNSLFFGDVCDAAVIDVSAPSLVEMPDYENAAIPIDVTVMNTGTTTQDVPVEVCAYPKIYEALAYDDFEGGYDPDEDGYWGNWEWYDFGNADSTFMVSDDDFNTPFNSMYYGLSGHQYDAGGIAMAVYQYDYDWDYLRDKQTFDIKARIKWQFGNEDYVTTAVRVNNQWVRLVSSDITKPGWTAGGSSPPHPESGGWIEFSFAEELYGYIYNYVGSDANFNNLHALSQFWSDAYGTGDLNEDDIDWGICVMGSSWYNALGPEGDEAWSGVHLDDYEIFVEYQDETPVWCDTIIVEDMEQGDIEDLRFWWNTTLYSDYIINASVRPLECDEYPRNDYKTTETRIQKTIYDNDYTEAETFDNTVGLEDDWHIVEECSDCPNDHFWWNGIIDDDGEALYQAEADDVLRMLSYEGADEDDDDEPDNAAYIDVKNETFVLTGATDVTLTFDAWWSNEEYYDYAFLEVSNDAGHNWYPVYEMTGEHPYWATIELELYNAGGTGVLQTIDDVWGYWYGLGPSFWSLIPDVGTGFPIWPITRPIIPTTDEMQFRFHFFADGGVQQKGTFIDNVELEVDGMMVYEDDIEDGDAKWIHMAEPTGDIWREEADYWINADAYESWYNGYTIGDGWAYYDITEPGYYRNNLDNKLVLSFNLTNAYEAIFSWEQKYNFAGLYPEDYGIVEVWTEGAWKALALVSGGTPDWQPGMLDISTYADNDELTKIRFRMITNETIIGEGWQVRNFTIEGKLDDQAPTSYATLEPGTPQCNGWYNTGVQVKLTASDNIGVDFIKYRIDGGAWLTYTAPFTLNLDGEHTVEFYAVDTVGNVGATGSTSFKIDTTNPTGSITMPQAGYIYFMGRELMPRILRDPALIIGGLNAAASASDATSGVDYVTFTTGAGSVEDAVAPYGYPLPFYLFGSDTLTVSVTDEACNTANIGSVDFFKIF